MITGNKKSWNGEIAFIMISIFFLMSFTTMTVPASSQQANNDKVVGPNLLCEPVPYIPPRWMLPTGYNDPQNAWHNETYSFDGSIVTKAGCTITQPGWVWTPWLEFTLSSPINCNKIRFFAWYDPIHCASVDIDINYPYHGGWQHCYDGWYESYEWVESSTSSYPVEKARIRFYVNRVLWLYVVADLYEFQFYGSPLGDNW